MANKINEDSFFKKFITLGKNTITGFMGEDGMKYSASLSYYTIFSMGPILVLMISLAGIFYGEDAIRGRVFAELNGILGANAAMQIQSIIQNLALSGKTNTALIISIITLVIGATTVFGDIQNSINRIWHVRAKPEKGWLKMIKDRLLSSSLIIGLGFLLVVTLIVNGLILSLTHIIQQQFPGLYLILLQGINFTLTFGIIFTLFMFIFKILPDVNIQWKTVRAGALFTSILFVIGKFIIGLYLQSSGTESTYGAAGAIVIILLWVYYTAAILYLGAVFTREYASYKGIAIEPAEYAVYVQSTEVEREVGTIPAAPLTKEELALQASTAGSNTGTNKT
ncbi:YihY/virulence factor BrkB family protein [Sphingobacterium sp. Mn56C]|uniref:YihY/virulence factor BrkB family protein n=1 Tax=Sphingobacterium sp. Mn56C TaxID=3395261 RepID=UPI003BED5A12